ncbi:hypothetical protein ACN28S_41810 [Cystobacter fuscus]
MSPPCVQGWRVRSQCFTRSVATSRVNAKPSAKEGTGRSSLAGRSTTEGAAQ